MNDLDRRARKPAHVDNREAGLLDDSVGAAVTHLAASLVDPGERKKIEAIARLLPAAAISLFGFECHLNKDPHADFIVRITTGERDLFASQFLKTTIFGEEDAPIWSCIRQFSENWVLPHSPLHEGIVDLWLEFDVDKRSTQMPSPIVFAGLNREYTVKKAGSAETSRQWLWDTVLSLLRGQHINNETVATLRSCFAALPVDAHVSYVGSTLARGEDALRVCVGNVPADQVSGYLRRIGWAGPFHELDAIVARASRLSHINLVDIDVGASIRPRIGLECALPWTEDPSWAVPHWRRFLDDLVDIGLCPAEQRDGLLEWPGLAPFFMDEMPDLANPQLLGDGQKPMASGWLIRHIRHVKISLQANKPLEAKAYLLCITRKRRDDGS